MLVSPGICYLFLIYCLLFQAYLGWGKLAASALGIHLHERESCFPLVWLGWAISLVLFQTVQLFLPLTPWLSAVFFLVGLLFLLRHNSGREGILAGFRTIGVGYWLVLVLGGVWIAGHALTEPKLYDSGLYHFNAIRWLLEYPLIPGLGNLHGRLAFNQSFFAYVASLQAFPPFSYGHNLANSFLLILVFAECIFPLFVRARTTTELSRLMLLVKAACIPLILIYGRNYALSSPSPDLGSAILRIVLFYNFVEMLGGFRAGQRDTAGIKLTMFLAAVAITVKLSNIMFAVSLICLCSFLYLAGRSKAPSTGNGRDVWYVVFLLLSIGLWAGRGIILSGCPAYPSSALCLDVEWAVPADQVAAEAQSVYRSVRGAKSNTKVPKDYLLNRKWMVKWFDTMWQWKAGFAYPVSLAVAAIVAAGASIIFARDKLQRKGNALLSLAMVPPFSALIFWFITAPHLRFADPFIFLLALAGFLPWLVPADFSRFRSLFLPLTILVLINIPLLLGQIQIGSRHEFLIKSSPSTDPIPQAVMEKYKTLSGLELYTPVKGDQCWDSPLPATPNKNPNLRLRGDSITSGFISKK